MIFRTQEKTAELRSIQAEMKQEAFDLGAQAAKDGAKSTDYNPQLYALQMRKKMPDSELILQYFKGFHSVTDK